MTLAADPPTDGARIARGDRAAGDWTDGGPLMLGTSSPSGEEPLATHAAGATGAGALPPALRTTGGTGDASLGERFVHTVYRLAWPTVLGGAFGDPLRSRGDLRLLATMRDPVAGDPAAGKAIRAGHFLVQGTRLAIGSADFADARLPARTLCYLHGFLWLRDLAAAGPASQFAPLAQRIAAAWLAAQGDGRRGPGWRVEPSAWRVLAWLAHAPLLLAGEDKVLRGRMLRSLVATARHLDRKVPGERDGLAQLAGWCAIVAAGLMLPGGTPRRIFGETGLARCLGEVMCADGGLVSRMPLAQIDAIAALAMLREAYEARSMRPPVLLSRALAMAVPPLAALLHGDRGLSSWQGAGGLPPEPLARVFAAAGVPARPLRDARYWGYQRITAGPGVLIADAGPPPGGRHARAGCASTLAFELSHGDQRIIVNCGGAALAGPFVPPRLALGLRATAAHSTLCLDDHNSTQVLPEGRLGRGVVEVELERRELEQMTRLEMAHDGYAQRYGFIHRRILMVRAGGGEVRGQDMLVPSGKRERRRATPYAVRFHLAPGVEAHAAAGGRAALLRLPDGGLWQLHAPDHRVEIEESLWVDGAGRPHPTQQLVIADVVSRGGATAGWVLKNMGG